MQRSCPGGAADVVVLHVGKPEILAHVAAANQAGIDDDAEYLVVAGAVAVAGLYDNVGCGELGIVRRPGDQAAGGIDGHAGRCIDQAVGDRVAIGIDGIDVIAVRLASDADHGRSTRDARWTVDRNDGNCELLHGLAATAVADTHGDGMRADLVVGRCPFDAAAGGVDAHAGGHAVQVEGEYVGRIGIAGLGVVAIQLAARGLAGRRGGEHGRLVGAGHGNGCAGAVVARAGGGWRGEAALHVAAFGQGSRRGDAGSQGDGTAVRRADAGLDAVADRAAGRGVACRQYGIAADRTAAAGAGIDAAARAACAIAGGAGPAGEAQPCRLGHCNGSRRIVRGRVAGGRRRSAVGKSGVEADRAAVGGGGRCGQAGGKIHFVVQQGDGAGKDWRTAAGLGGAEHVVGWRGNDGDDQGFVVLDRRIVDLGDG